MSGKLDSGVGGGGAVVLGCVGILCIMIINAALRGLALSYLWGWFVRPLNPAIPDLTVWWAYGLAMVVWAVVPMQNQSGEKKDFGVWVLASFIAPFVVIAIGYLVHSLAFRGSL